MRILIVNNRYPSASRPYVASWLKEIYKIVKREFPQTRLLVDRGNSRRKLGQVKDLMRFYLRILTGGVVSNHDVLFLHHFNMYWFVIKKRIKSQDLIIHWHGSEIKNGSMFSKPQRWNRDKKLINCIHIAPSFYFKDLMQKKMPDLKQIEVIPSGGVDTELFKNTKSRMGENTLVIGFASKLITSKGVQFLLFLGRDKTSLERLANKKIKIIAIDYGANAQVKKELLNLPIQLLPPMSKESLPQFYDQLDILLFPSHHESLGLVPIEAMSCGVPILCPNDFAAPEYCIPNVSGELYTPHDYNSFKEYLIKIITSRSEYNPRRTVQDRFSQAYCQKRYAEVINKAHAN